MKTTKYFDKNKGREDRRTIKAEWIQYVSDNPVKTVVQKDGRIRKRGKIEETSGKYLRVVLLKDGVTVHNAFFDRRFKEFQKRIVQ